MRLEHLPPEWRARLEQERREAIRAANVFARICREGDADALYNAHLLLNEVVNAWRPAMAKVAKLPRVSSEIQNVFVGIWVENKMLPLRVGHRPTMAAALRVLLPGGYSGSSMTLYRGTHGGERRRRLYGFSWTTDIAIARMFAESRAGLKEWPPVVLRTETPPEAVLLIRPPEDFYDEGEVVVDPFRLGKIEVARWQP
jgi:hypothetical protein